MNGPYKHKLREAKFFYAHMVDAQNSRDHFRYCLNAFLSASRSVLQYADKETNLGKNRMER